MNSASLLPGGRYRLLESIGEGGFGLVRRAVAPGGVEVAVKILNRPASCRKARREVRALRLVKRLRHPFLLQTQAFWRSGDQLYVVMELADGSLRDRLNECRRSGLTGIPASELLTYCREAAEALDYLHAQHVLHGDIKPANILLLQGHAKVADLGLARLLGDHPLGASSSGTPEYMAPEVWDGKVCAHSDQYSLALTYAELRLGRRIFPGRCLGEIIDEHRKSTPDLAPLPAEERDVLLRALAKGPEQRYPTCGEFGRSLGLALADAAATRFCMTGGPPSGICS